jgi:membrane protease YdiL (CAAX protease family)
MMSYRAKFRLLGALTIAAVLVAGVVFAQFIPLGGGSPQPLLIYPLMLALYVPVLALTWLWWRKIDDLQQQGQLVSWYWGGTFGGLALLIYVITFFGRESDFTQGAVMMATAQLAGFLIVWFVWLLRGRGQSE